MLASSTNCRMRNVYTYPHPCRPPSVAACFPQSSSTNCHRNKGFKTNIHKSIDIILFTGYFIFVWRHHLLLNRQVGPAGMLHLPLKCVDPSLFELQLPVSPGTKSCSEIDVRKMGVSLMVGRIERPTHRVASVNATWH